MIFSGDDKTDVGVDGLSSEHAAVDEELKRLGHNPIVLEFGAKHPMDVADEHRAGEVVGDPAEAQHPREREADRNKDWRMALDMPAQRLEIGDVVVLRLSGEDATAEAKLVRNIDRTPTIVRAKVRTAEGRDFVQEWLWASSSLSFAVLDGG